MNNIRAAIGEVFQSPMANMNFIQYLGYLNTTGKITAKSQLELSMVILTYLEEYEKKFKLYDENFKQIEAVLTKLVNNKVEEKKDPIDKVVTKESIEALQKANEELISQPQQEVK